MKQYIGIKKYSRDLTQKIMTVVLKKVTGHQDYHYQAENTIGLHPCSSSSIGLSIDKLKVEKKNHIFLKKKMNWMKYTFGVACLIIGGIFIQEQLSFLVINHQDELALQVNHAWPHDRTFKLWWGEELLTEKTLPALNDSYLAFEKELIAMQDQLASTISIAPTIEETDTSFKISWEAAKPTENCQLLKVSTLMGVISVQDDYCVSTPINHYELRKGTELIAITNDLEFSLDKKSLVDGFHEFEWVVVNQNGIETVRPISLEHYSFNITEDYKLTNPTPYDSLTYSILQGEEWVGMESNDLTPFLKDSKIPEITSVNIAPNSSKKEISVSVKGKDIEETLTYQFNMSHEDSKFYSSLQTTYQSEIAYYEGGIGEVGSHSIKSEDGTFTFSSLKPGSHKIWVRAVDHAGNVSKVWTQETEIEDLTVVTDSVVNVQQSTSSSSASSNSSLSGSSSRPTDQKAQMLYSMTSCYSGVSTSTCDSIINSVHRVLPYSIVEMLYINNTVIDIMPNNIRDVVRNITGWDPGWNYHGVTFINTHGQSKHIYTSVKGGRNVFIHEIGHVYDYYRALCSRGSRFTAIYEAEKGIFTGLYASSSNEFFAEAFRMYITEPSNLAKRAPQTYNYMKDLIG